MAKVAYTVHLKQAHAGGGVQVFLDGDECRWEMGDTAEFAMEKMIRRIGIDHLGLPKDLLPGAMTHAVYARADILVKWMY